MKRFHFPLARVRDLRRRQLEMEEAKLQTLLAERRALDTELSRIGTEADSTRCALMVTGSVESQELAAFDTYLRHLSAEKKRQEGKVAEWQSRALLQREAVVQARKRVRLLEMLEAKRFREWTAAVNREQENLSAELYLARWNRT